MAAPVIRARRPGLWTGVLLATMATGLLSVAQVAHATTYGEGSFGKCSYVGCEAGTPTTVVSSGSFKISVNVADNQTVPNSGYTILVKLLSDPAVPLKKVEFYIDGKLMATVTPSDPTVVHWFWDTKLYPGSTLKIVATDANGNVITREFKIAIASATEVPAEVPGPLEVVHDTLVDIVASLPQPVIYVVPYFLFLLLGINGVVLLSQTRREVAELRIIQQIAATNRITSQAKQTLIELVSHYLRTPITLINGGVDMLNEGDATKPQVKSLQAVSERIRLTVEALVAQVDAVREKPTGQAAYEKVQIWRQPAMFVPIVLIAVVAAGFDYLAGQAGSLSPNQANDIAQVMVFGLVTALVYVVSRRHHLKRRDARQLQVALAEQTATIAARDALIASAISGLNAELRQFDIQLEQLGPMKPELSRIIRDGQSRFHDILGKFAIASQLKGGQSTAPLVTTRLSELFADALQEVKSTADERRVAVTLANDVPVASRSIPLASFVLTTVLDNAVAYSTSNSQVVVGATVVHNSLVVTVADSGGGIPAAKASLLFQPFSKTEGAEVFNHEGMGFSLYLDKLIMVYLGGDISIDSHEGRGTVVSIRF